MAFSIVFSDWRMVEDTESCHLCVALCLVLVARLAHQVVHTLQIVGINFLESGLFFALQMQALAHTFGAGLGTAHVFVAVLCYGKGRNAAHGHTSHD